MDEEARLEQLEQLDEGAVALFAWKVWSFKQGEVVSLMIHLGDRLGLYRAMAGAGLMAPAELAERTGLHERWVREWLLGQAAAEIVEHDRGERFSLSDEGAAVLVDEDRSLAFAAGAFMPTSTIELADALVEAFRTGVGLTYEQLGAHAAHRTERMLGPWSRLALVPTIIPALEGVEATLRAGGSLADVGCGAGVAAIAMAQAFPTAEVHGYDPSHHAVNRARESAERAGVKNLTFHTEPGEDLPEGAGFDLVTTLDVLHDLPHPGRVLRAIRRAMADDGTLLVKETRCRPAFEDNLHNPFLPMLYGFSVSACMSSALSEPDGAGLGTVGLPRERLEDMADAAGFSGLAEHDFGDPANLYYEVRA